MIFISLFAHKKGTGSSHNGRDSEAKRLGTKRSDGQAVLAGNILVVKEVRKFTPAQTLVSARTTPFSRSWTVSFVTKEWAKTRKKQACIP